MSMQDLSEAMKIVNQNLDESDFEGPKSEELIRKAETFLSLKFPKTYRSFLRELGCGSFAGEEFYGIIHDNFRESSIPDAIWLSSGEKVLGLPKHFVIVYATGEGTYYALDTSHFHEEECSVVAWTPGTSSSETKAEVIAEDFGRFFLDCVKEALLA